MSRLDDAKVIELFHLAFLQVLQARLKQDDYVLKGGANLRYFFNSARYSEDLDLDVGSVEPWRLTEKVDGILDSRPMGFILRGSDLAVAGFTKPKQTDTTRRWKVSIEAPGRSDPVRTKIEFSYRNGEQRHLLEAVPRRIVGPYALRPPTVQHYTVDAATEQKARALAGRSETQARDVFDLDLLFRLQPQMAASVGSQILAEAAHRALELPFAALRDQVLPFLEPGVAELYDTATAWEQMQVFVADKLLEGR